MEFLVNVNNQQCFTGLEQLPNVFHILAAQKATTKLSKIILNSACEIRFLCQIKVSNQHYNII